MDFHGLHQLFRLHLRSDPGSGPGVTVVLGPLVSINNSSPGQVPRLSFFTMTSTDEGHWAGVLERASI